VGQSFRTRVAMCDYRDGMPPVIKGQDASRLSLVTSLHGLGETGCLEVPRSTLELTTYPQTVRHCDGTEGEGMPYGSPRIVIMFAAASLSV
jgi:hypothetical protein